MTTTMSKARREEYLAGFHVGIVSLIEPGRGPLAVPIWYDYEIGGELRFLTDKGTRKERLLAENVRISLCVQDEKPPYRYVSIEGPIVSIEPELNSPSRPLTRS